MKREFLKELGLEDEVIEKVMAENGSDIQKEKAKTVKAETERDTYKGQLTTTQETLKTYEDMDIDGIKKSAKELQEKYDKDTQELQDKLSKQSYEVSAKEYLGQYKFANRRIAESIKSDFLSKEFKLEEGKFLGADDYIKGLQESEPESFVLEEEDDEEKVPTIVKSTAGSKPGKKMSLEEAMQYVNTHPDTDITTLI
ncbi:phage scaffolding protein [Clostridium botulinum]|uniref:phage scaffolding protein n=1 Tax=Clostridium botulinum TaxID=1491 RepID=UPI002247BB56|nr:phage scaffolding protein [Clostridium botulinum]UZP04385.1 phage scaffolding protein [Clostridium botulinum]UZP07743.1 phage scaffolding protein [Clostridium botulinum]UZP07797.1 phage scaffolding protein [Clostridium botulinum]UZP11124.1 phage scaffolding protein [Clostridium botulinum]